MSKRKTLVFIHGLTGTSSAWEEYERGLDTKFNIILFDLRGHGNSFKPAKYEDYSIKNFSEDLYNILEHEKIKKVVLVCHSFGALLGLEFLKNHQEMVNSAVFICPVLRLSANKRSNQIKKILRYIMFVNVIPIKKKIGFKKNYAKYRDKGDMNIRRIIHDLRNTGIKIYLWTAKQMYDYDAETIFKEIKVPVLLIFGKKDKLFSYEDSLVMGREIKGSKIILFEDTDHVKVINKYNELSKAIEEFLK